MSGLGERKRTAVEAVARRFCATWEAAPGGSPDAYLSIAAGRIAVEVAAIESRVEGRDVAKPRLRFDKVAVGLVGRLRAALSQAVADGEAVVLTVTAPIRSPAKTAAALEGLIRDLLARRSAPADAEATICGNRIRVRLVRGVPRRAPKLIGFVHNRESDPDALVRLAQSLLQAVGAATERRPPQGFTGERWLVLAGDDGPARVEAARCVCSQLAAATQFSAILMVLADGRVETLGE
ncbi:MAG TPA: hypothetical protein VMU93_12960 [Caulobacteraceae bacterium]|nr:hypothetical protein [Caulobacteraceae bacterium]